MATYRVEILPAAERQMGRIDFGPRRRIDAVILALAGDRRPHGCRKMSGSDEYPIRVGDYRVLYEIEDATLRAFIVKVGHRRDVYA